MNTKLCEKKVQIICTIVDSGIPDEKIPWINYHR